MGRHVMFIARINVAAGVAHWCTDMLKGHGFIDDVAKLPFLSEAKFERVGERFGRRAASLLHLLRPPSSRLPCEPAPGHARRCHTRARSTLLGFLSRGEGTSDALQGERRAWLAYHHH